MVVDSQILIFSIVHLEQNVDNPIATQKEQYTCFDAYRNFVQSVTRCHTQCKNNVQDNAIKWQ